MEENSNLQSPWYKDGLRFKCTECGKCCTGQPGYVWVGKDEIKRIAEYLKIPVDKFMRQYLRQKNNQYALLENRSQNFDCVFLQDKKCRIYEARPTQCKTYPWWAKNLRSEKDWKSAANDCEGINETAPIIPCGEIEKGLRDNVFN